MRRCRQGRSEPQNKRSQRRRRGASQDVDYSELERSEGRRSSKRSKGQGFDDVLTPPKAKRKKFTQDQAGPSAPGAQLTVGLCSGSTRARLRVAAGGGGGGGHPSQRSAVRCDATPLVRTPLPPRAPHPGAEAQHVSGGAASPQSAASAHRPGAVLFAQRCHAAPAAQRARPVGLVHCLSLRLACRGVLSSLQSILCL